MDSERQKIYELKYTFNVYKDYFEHDKEELLEKIGIEKVDEIPDWAYLLIKLSLDMVDSGIKNDLLYKFIHSSYHDRLTDSNCDSKIPCELKNFFEMEEENPMCPDCGCMLTHHNGEYHCINCDKTVKSFDVRHLPELNHITEEQFGRLKEYDLLYKVKEEQYEKYKETVIYVAKFGKLCGTLTICIDNENKATNKLVMDKEKIEILICNDCKEQVTDEKLYTVLGNDIETEDNPATADYETYECEHCGSRNVSWIKILKDQTYYKIDSILREADKGLFKCEHCRSKINTKMCQLVSSRYDSNTAVKMLVIKCPVCNKTTEVRESRITYRESDFIPSEQSE